MRLEYVFGFLISLRHTIIRISLVITLAGGMADSTAVEEALALGFMSSTVELEPSFDSAGPSAVGTCLFPKQNSSSRPKSS